MLTKKCKYGLKAMIHLCKAECDQLVPVKKIATEENIPHKFLDNILSDLKAAGFLSSRKGKGGGYCLAVSPANITIGSIIRILNGPLAPITCASITKYEPCIDCDVPNCETRQLMCEARDAISAIFDHRTLAAIAKPATAFL